MKIRNFQAVFYIMDIGSPNIAITFGDILGSSKMHNYSNVCECFAQENNVITRCKTQTFSSAHCGPVREVCWACVPQSFAHLKHPVGTRQSVCHSSVRDCLLSSGRCSDYYRLWSFLCHCACTCCNVGLS